MMVKRVLFTVGIIALGFATPVSATMILDQNFVTTDDPDHNTGQGSPNSLAQTFTVGVTGTLAAVEFNVLKVSAAVTNNLTVDIRPVVGGVPDPN